MGDVELYHAWKLLQMLYDVYEAEDEQGARERIEAFVHRWTHYPVPEFKTVLKVLAQWLPQILAFHRCERITNGRLEARTISSECSSASPTGSSTPTTSRPELCCGVLRWHHDRAERGGFIPWNRGEPFLCLSLGRVGT